MDFYESKENIQPLATGRNVSILQASIVHSQQELLEQRKELEAAIHNYNGTDPLEPWYNYIQWIEQSFPSGGKESGLMEVLSKCLRRFESEERYYQDRRMIKLFIKFLDSQKDSIECYQQLYNAGIGTMVADLYIAWAYCYDSFGQTRKADEIFRRGIECRAEPLEDLKEAHLHFGFAIAQRTLYKDDEDALETANRQIEERRSALSSLRSYRGRICKNEVGSIRTGSAIKNLRPGTINTGADGSQAASTSNARVAVLTDENANPNIEKEDEKSRNEIENSEDFPESASVVRSIVDKARHQENEKEPGPWNRVHDEKNKKKILRQKKVEHNLAFDIHEDKEDDKIKNENENSSMEINENIILTESECNYDRPFKYPENFVSKNNPQREWIVPITTETKPDPDTIPQYNKCMIYPRPNQEYQPEELCAYLYYKKRNIENEFTHRYNNVWGNGINVPIRLYPNFARTSKCSPPPDELDKFWVPPREENVQYMIQLNKIYNEEKQEEFQISELMAQRLAQMANDTVMAIEDMDETMCANSNNEEVQRRKSFFPTRRSIAIRSVITAITESNTSNNIKGQWNTQNCKLEEIPEILNENIVLSAKKQPINEKKEKQLVSPSLESEESRQLLMGEANTMGKINSPNDDFNFKTPAVPIKESKLSPELKIPSPPPQAVNKLPFEIYVEENTTTQTTQSPSNFDADETCTTQAFNNFIKSQLASTPKPAEKKMQKRQFGVLDIPTPITLTSPTESVTSPSDTASASPSSPDVQIELPTNSSSPLLRKQLSTILETSEHATTHGTQSNGTSTTKSTNGSQESDLAADAAANASENVVSIQPTNTNTSKNVVDADLLMENQAGLKIPTISTQSSVNTFQTEQNHVGESCGDANKIVPSSPQKFSIYIDDTETWSTFPQLPSINKDVITNVGNFERMIEREDTATGRFAVCAPARFEDDKTETITKLPVPHIFPEEQTVTVPKINVSMFGQDSRAPFSSSNARLTQNQSKITTSAGQLQAATSGLSKENEDDDEESFEFFIKSPIKTFKSPIPKSKEPIKIIKKSQIFTEKRNNEMELMKYFENEMMNIDDDEDDNYEVNYSGQQQTKYNEEFFRNPIHAQGAIRKKSKFVDTSYKKADNLGMSFLPDLSIVGKTPSKTKDEVVKSAKNLMQMSVASESSTKKDAEKKDYMNFSVSESFIAETQPADAKADVSAKSLFVKTSNIENKSLKTQDSFLPDTSIIESSQPVKEKLQKSQAINSTLSISSLKKQEPASQSNRNVTGNYQLAEKSYRDTRIPQRSTKSIKHTDAMQNNSFIPETQELPVQTTSHTKSSNISYQNSRNEDLNKNDINRSIINNACNSSNTNRSRIPIFEVNGETEMFSTGMSMIKNSTMIPTNSLRVVEQTEYSNKITEDKQNNRSKYNTDSKNSEISNRYTPFNHDHDQDMSIYFKNTPRTPIPKSWSDDNSMDSDDDYMHHSIDLNETTQRIQEMCRDKNVNPFNVDLVHSFLDSIEFSNFLHSMKNTMLVGKAPRLNINSTFHINNIEFKVMKVVGEGAYGTIYRGVEKKSGKECAFKQERPPNHWEYYITLEVQSRIRKEEILPAYMNIDYALIGNNASIFVSDFSHYGSIINVCNKIKKYTQKNVDEYVVMHLTCELLEIMDHLHAAGIIHADVKADNFLLMKKLTYNSMHPSLQLIDFGVSIDMKHFKEGQQFTYIHNDNAFKCVEMRENRPWSFQLDLYGLAGVIHVILFGKYMEIEKHADKCIWMPKTYFPRYINKTLWENIFRTLLNVRDSKSMPDLQNLRSMIKEEMAEKERFVIDKIALFNKALDA